MSTAAAPFESPPIDAVGVEERVARLCSRSIKKEAKLQALHLTLSMIDLTTLEGADSDGKVRQLCAKALQLHAARPDLPHVAAVCVYPALVGTAKQALRGSGIAVASVATSFPPVRRPWKSSCWRCSARSRPAPTKSTW